MKGKLYLAPLCKINLLPDHVKIRLLITRSGRKIKGVAWYPQLAPSIGLFERYLSEWKEGKVENWWNLYTEKFTAELLQEPKHSAIKKLYNILNDGNPKEVSWPDVALICFCTNRQCHRYIIADVMKIAGIEVKEIL